MSLPLFREGGVRRGWTFHRVAPTGGVRDMQAFLDIQDLVAILAQYFELQIATEKKAADPRSQHPPPRGAPTNIP